LAVTLCAVVALGAMDERLVTPEEIYGTVSLRIEGGADGAFTGLLKNSGTQAVRNVRLLVNHSWLWKNERNPGPVENNPARAEYYVVGGEVPAGGELRFRYAPSPPLPQRTDGHFSTTATIVGLTEVGAPEF
jgi:hypothetical protein